VGEERTGAVLISTVINTGITRTYESFSTVSETVLKPSYALSAELLNTYKSFSTVSSVSGSFETRRKIGGEILLLAPLSLSLLFFITILTVLTVLNTVIAKTYKSPLPVHLVVLTQLPLGSWVGNRPALGQPAFKKE
jgi:hypothetical protein